MEGRRHLLVRSLPELQEQVVFVWALVLREANVVVDGRDRTVENPSNVIAVALPKSVVSSNVLFGRQGHGNTIAGRSSPG